MKSSKKNTSCKCCDCCKNYKGFICSCHISRKTESVIRYSSCEAINLRNKCTIDLICKIFFKENKCKLMEKKYHTKLIEDLNCLSLTFGDFICFLATLDQNKFFLNYFFKNLSILVKDSSNLREFKIFLPILVYNILNNVRNTTNFRNIDFNIPLNIFNTFKSLHGISMIQNNIPSLNKSIIILEFPRKNLRNLDYKLFTFETQHAINSQKSESFKLEKFYHYYISLISDYNYLKRINVKLVEKINKLEVNLKSNNIDYNVVKCKMCSKLKENLQILTEKYNIITKNYSTFQIEKERMVMKYATSEKCVIETQRNIKLTERKYQDALKENAILHKRIKKTHDIIVKLTSEINSKSSEVLQLRNEIEHCKDTDNSKELQLKWMQNRIKYITDAHKETEIKLNQSLMKTSELTIQREQLRCQMEDTVKKVQKIEETKATILDKQLKEQQARIILERHIAEDSESSRAKLQKEFDLLLDKQHVADNENHVLSTQLSALKKECEYFKSKLNIANLSIEKDKSEIQSLKNEVSEMKVLNKRLESKEKLIRTMEIELNRLYIERTEFQADIEAYRQREIQMLDFTEKLTDKNVQLQCEFTNMKSKVCYLENSQKPLNKTINKYITEIKNLEYNLSSEKTKRMQECEILAKYIAEQAFHNQKLSNQIEELEGENHILRKKYELTMREMTRELHSYQSKVKSVDLSISSPSQESSYNNTLLYNTDKIDIPLLIDKENEKCKVYNLILEKDKLLNQIIKLQKINVKRAEKLDFLEEHSRALLQELQKKTKIIQDYSLQTNILINSDKY